MRKLMIINIFKRGHKQLNSGIDTWIVEWTRRYGQFSGDTEQCYQAFLSKEEADEFDNTYGGCGDIYELGEILERDYDVQIWDNFGEDVLSLRHKFGLGAADFDSNCGNLGFDYDVVTGKKRVRFVDYGFKVVRAKDDRWNPLISELISA